MVKLVCENNIWGIYTAVYDIWAMKLDRENVTIITDKYYEYDMFSEYIEVESSEIKCNKVMKTIKEKFGSRLLKMLTYAVWADDYEKGDIVYRTIEYALRCFNSRQAAGEKILKIESDLTKPYIRKLNDLYKKVYFELDHFYGFVRFSELSNGCLFSEIRPKSYLLEGLAEHFSDRLPAENWIIYDVSRECAAIHRRYSAWILANNIHINREDTLEDISEIESKYRELWKNFFDTIAITEREDKKLQRNNLPIRFREYMTEFK